MEKGGEGKEETVAVECMMVVVTTHEEQSRE